MLGFKGWIETTESTYTAYVGRETIRDVYPLLNGVNIINDVKLPHNVFKSQSEYAVVDYALLESIKSLIEEVGGELSTEWYTEEGYGVAIFRGDDALEKAYDFGMTVKEN